MRAGKTPGAQAVPAGLPAATATPVSPAAIATPVPPVTLATLVTGPSAALRERLVAAALPPSGRSAAILEGLPDGSTTLAPGSSLELHRVAPACLCCTGNLVLRVTLNRILRLRPDRLFIGVANLDHLDQLRSWLQNPPYDQLLELTPDLHGT